MNILQLGNKDFLASSKIVSNVMGASQKIEYGQFETYLVHQICIDPTFQN